MREIQSSTAALAVVMRKRCGGHGKMRHGNGLPPGCKNLCQKLVILAPA
jgi:hypothetical protein